MRGRTRWLPSSNAWPAPEGASGAFRTYRPTPRQVPRSDVPVDRVVGCRLPPVADALGRRETGDRHNGQVEVAAFDPGVGHSAAVNRRSETPLDKKRRSAAHPDRPGERCNAAPGTWTPVVDHGRCEGKADCVTVCPHDVFEVRRIEPADWRALGLLARLRVTAHGKSTAYTPRADQCQACGLCVVACPERAITLMPPSGGG